MRYADAYGQNFVDAVCIAGDQVPQAIIDYNTKAVNALNTYGAAVFDAAKRFSYSDEVYNAMFNNEINPINIHEMGNVGIRPECYVQKNIISNAKANQVVNAIDSITTAGDTYITEFQNGLYAEAVEAANESFKPVVLCVAVDLENCQIVGRGGNSIHSFNPSICPDLPAAGESYTIFYRKFLQDESIDQLAAANPGKYTEEEIASIKTELGKLKERIDNTKELAKKENLNTNFDEIDNEPSFEKRHYVDNCAEIWAARDAILQGAKMDNLAFRSMSAQGTTMGMPYAFCENCKHTFGDSIEYKINIK